MKFWKKSNGVCGTMNDNGHVPDSVDITEQEYLDWVASQPVPKIIKQKAEFATMKSDSERISFIAKKLDLIE